MGDVAFKLKTKIQFLRKIVYDKILEETFTNPKLRYAFFASLEGDYGISYVWNTEIEYSDPKLYPDLLDRLKQSNFRGSLEQQDRLNAISKRIAELKEELEQFREETAYKNLDPKSALVSQIFSTQFPVEGLKLRQSSRAMKANLPMSTSIQSLIPSETFPYVLSVDFLISSKFKFKDILNYLQKSNNLLLYSFYDNNDAKGYSQFLSYIISKDVDNTSYDLVKYMLEYLDNLEPIIDLPSQIEALAKFKEFVILDINLGKRVPNYSFLENIKNSSLRDEIRKNNSFDLDFVSDSHKLVYKKGLELGNDSFRDYPVLSAIQNSKINHLTYYLSLNKLSNDNLFFSLFNAKDYYYIFLYIIQDIDICASMGVREYELVRIVGYPENVSYEQLRKIYPTLNFLDWAAGYKRYDLVKYCMEKGCKPRSDYAILFQDGNEIQKNVNNLVYASLPWYKRLLSNI